ncbi:unnamed protein product [marine sediment metagenome]|uniref:Uncharacterized protein n=1 Tax=marine sediment metagenome TaxID=412755 RepID=X0WB10_9ZZZZ
MSTRKLNVWLMFMSAIICGVLNHFLKEPNWALFTAIWVLYLIFYKEK